MSRGRSDEMLGLAVHALPDPTASTSQTLRSSRLKLLAIVFLCSLPVLVAYLAYYVVRPQGEAAFGALITPVRAMPDAQATTLEGRPVALSSLKAQWLLVKIDGAACVQDCQKQLVLLRQLRLMLGKDMDRVDWLWLIDDQAAVDPVLAHNLASDQATVLRVASAQLQAWFAAPAGQSLKDFIFVVDPMGNTMMRFPISLDSAAAAKAKRDMEHLLRASVAWDSPGR